MVVGVADVGIQQLLATRVAYFTHPESGGGVGDGGAHKPSIEQLEPCRPRPSPLHDDANLGDVLIITKVLSQVE